MSSSTSSSSSAAAAAAAQSNGKEQVMAQQQQMMKMNMKKKKMKMKTNSSGPSRMPSAEELIKHYEDSEGMDTKQASIKVINDLQKALFTLITTTSKPQHHLHVINSRLLSLDIKLDSKPGYPHMLGLGVVSAATYRTLETRLFPQLSSAFANIWNAVRSTTNTNTN